MIRNCILKESKTKKLNPLFYKKKHEKNQNK